MYQATVNPAGAQTSHRGTSVARSMNRAAQSFLEPGDMDMDSRRKSGFSRGSTPSRNPLVETLVRSPVFREYQRAFEDATGLPLTLRAVEGWQLAHHQSRQQNGFCALMSQSNRSCSACLQLQQRVCEGVNGAPHTMTCMFGLNETAVGVKIGQNVVAYLQTGQVLFKHPTHRQTERALTQIAAWGLSLDRSEAARRYSETRVISRGAYHATVHLLQFFADQLGATANQIIMRQQTAEPAQITRARRFIEKECREDLSLAAVAWHVGINRFSFCRIFKKATGLNFVRYRALCRVEKAKNLLLNHKYRVSEIAYEVGFQSLTNFNRVFKDLAGESATEYRRRLPATGNASADQENKGHQEVRQ